MNKNITIRRISKEVKEINDNPGDGYSVSPKNGNLYTLEAVLKGPKDTPYENGTFKLDIFYHDDYPFKPPKIVFFTNTLALVSW